MASTFQRFPINGGDNNTWGPIILENMSILTGLMTCKLYDDAGALKLSTGKIGLSDGSNIGTISISTAETLNFSGVGNGNWAVVEMYLTGSAVTYLVTGISGAVDANEIPTEFTGTYNPTKGGFYNTPLRRTLGIIYRGSGGDLEKVISCLSFENFSGEDVLGINNYVRKNNFAQFVRAASSPGYASPDTIVLDTEMFNFIEGCSLGTDGTLTVPPGLYKIYAFIKGTGVGTDAKVYLYDETNAEKLDSGTDAELDGVTPMFFGSTLTKYINISGVINVSLKTEGISSALLGAGAGANLSGASCVILEKIN